MSNKKLFGTDGVRGLYGRFPLQQTDVARLGYIAGQLLQKKSGNRPLRILLARDPRGSGLELSVALTAGLLKSGVDVYDAGVISTPATSMLVSTHRFDSGVVISASHNPPEFNGIKFFNNHGHKWPDAWELEVEHAFFGQNAATKHSPIEGTFLSAHHLVDDYQDFLIESLGSDPSLRGLRIILDCANGSNSELAPVLLKSLGVQIQLRGASPNGKNINVHCGSQHVESMARDVRKGRFDAGVAFDGDGDRVIFVDEKGQVVDGDHVIGILAKSYLDKNQLTKKSVVLTVMANLGLKMALRNLKIHLVETQVGDRYVSEAMRHHGAILGGEQSGHIILGRHLPSGDGLLTALHVLQILKNKRVSLSECAGFVKKFPQVLVNVPVKEKTPLENLNGVTKKMNTITKTLGEKGRLLVRYSGTEPLLRIMIEGPHKPTLDNYAQELAQHVLAAQR